MVFVADQRVAWLNPLCNRDFPGWVFLRNLLHELMYRVGHEKAALLPFCTRPYDILSDVIMYVAWSVWTVSQQSCCHHVQVYPSNIVILMAAAEWLMSSSSCIVCGFWFVYRTFQVSPEKISSPLPVREGGGGYQNQIRTWYRNWKTTLATQLQPSKSLCYIRYTSTCLDVRSCVLM